MTVPDSLSGTKEGRIKPVKLHQENRENQNAPLYDFQREPFFGHGNARWGLVGGGGGRRGRE